MRCGIRGLLKLFFCLSKSVYVFEVFVCVPESVHIRAKDKKRHWQIDKRWNKIKMNTIHGMTLRAVVKKKMLTKQWIRTAKEMIVMHRVTNTKTTTTNTKRPANNKWEQKENSLLLNIGTICWFETLNEQRNARTTKDKHHFHIILQIDLCITYAQTYSIYTCIIYTRIKIQNFYNFLIQNHDFGIKIALITRTQ